MNDDQETFRPGRNLPDPQTDSLDKAVLKNYKRRNAGADKVKVDFFNAPYEESEMNKTILQMHH